MLLTSNASSRGFIGTLPSIRTLPISRRTLLVERLRPNAVRDEGCHGEHAPAIELIEDAARRGDNVGTDEFPTSNRERFDTFMSHCETLSLSDVMTPCDVIGSNHSSDVKSGIAHGAGKLQALIIVCPCKPVRSVQPSTATGHIITSSQFSTKIHLRELIGLAEAFVRDWEGLLESRRAEALEGLGGPGPITRLDTQSLPAGERGGPYSAIIVNVFVSCVERLLAMREEGYLITATIPLAGVLQGFRGGHCSSYMLYKHLGYEDLAYFPAKLPLNHPASLLHLGMPPYHIRGPHHRRTPPYNLKTLTFLPLQHRLADGTRLKVRALSPVDVPAFYEAFVADIRRDTGYGYDELPSLSFFVQRYVNDWYTLVFVLDQTAHDATNLTSDAVTSAGSTSSSAAMSLSSDMLSSGSAMTSITSSSAMTSSSVSSVNKSPECQSEDRGQLLTESSLHSSRNRSEHFELKAGQGHAGIYTEQSHGHSAAYAEDRAETSRDEGEDFSDGTQNEVVVAYANYGPSSYARSLNPVIADVNIIILAEWRRRHWSVELMGVCLRGIAVSGYRGVQGEASVNNLASGLMGLQAGYVINGTLPNGIFYRDVGWVDSGLGYVALSDLQQRMESVLKRERKRKFVDETSDSLK